MSENEIGFIIWASVGLLIIGMGVAAFFRKKAVGFWANVNAPQVKETKKYNHAVGKLFIVYGVIFVLLGTPLLSERYTALILLSVLGIMLETIGIMIIYSQVISKKFGVE